MYKYTYMYIKFQRLQVFSCSFSFSSFHTCWPKTPAPVDVIKYPEKKIVPGIWSFPNKEQDFCVSTVAPKLLLISKFEPTWGQPKTCRILHLWKINDTWRYNKQDIYRQRVVVSTSLNKNKSEMGIFKFRGDNNKKKWNQDLVIMVSNFCSLHDVVVHQHILPEELNFPELFRRVKTAQLQTSIRVETTKNQLLGCPRKLVNG